MERPDVDSIDGLSPAISIEQKTTSRSPRSTVGTITEIYDYLRVLYSSIGVPHCPVCGNEISRQTTEQILQHVMALRPDDRIMVMAPVVRGRKGEYKKDLEKLARQGFVRARIDGTLRSLDEDIALDKRKNHTIEVVVDRLLVKPGEVVPVDGTVSGDAAVLDESALTGEARLMTREASDLVNSGTVNAGAPFDLVATATAEHSTYAGIVRLVEEAQSSKAPFVRLADRFALLFVPLTLFIAGAAWLVSGEPERALAVLVVATPCPLLLAAPIAIVAGISRSAKRGIIVKGGGALEALARARVMLFDKTGTLTAGRPHLADVLAAPGTAPDQVLRLAASLEQVSPHVLAASIVQGARARGVSIVLPEDSEEVAGAGVGGTVDGRDVRVGTAEFGTYFIGYCRTPRVTEQMIENMFIGRPPGNYDRLLDFSRAVTGTLFFVPSQTFLESVEE